MTKTIAITTSLVALLATACEVGSSSQDVDLLTYEEFVDEHIDVGLSADGEELLTFGYDEPLDTWDEVDALYESYLMTHSEGEVSRTVLLDTLPNGVGLVWDQATRQNLRYCVSTQFGARRAKVVAAMNEATRSWERYGNLNFVHATGEDANCTSTNSNVLFSVLPISGQRFIARAFFPKNYQDRARRNVFINDTAFSPSLSFPLAGILRHELGHTLGLRHETIQPASAAKYGAQCLENNLYLQITPGFDERSVMMTPACIGGNRMREVNPELELSARDKSGIISLYR